MQIATSGVTIETQGEITTQDFSIGDPGLIMEHMRKSIYSNPKKAICQELMSNGRDAHRETGKESTPIRVKMPNKLDKSWKIRDWGPGINPNRMKEVFTKFGNSTKRGTGAHATDNGKKQTGGFGIGAKTPWAYTDAFVITTTAMEGPKMVQRTYAAIIAEDRSCKLQEFAGAAREIDVNDESIPAEDRCTGTTISVDIKPEDFQEFTRWSVYVSQFWDVQPEFTGTDSPTEPKKWTWKYEGKGWKIGKCENSDYHSSRNYVIVDGICYPLETGNIQNLDSKYYNLLRAGLVLFVGVNDVSVALSREAIQFDPPTQAALKDLIVKAYDEIKARLESELVGAKNLWEARGMWNKMKETFNGNSFIDDAEWTDSAGVKHDVSRQNVGVTQGVTIRCHKKETNGGVVRFKSREESNFQCGETAMLIIDDEGFATTNRMRLETAFDNNPTVTNIYVIRFTNQAGKDWWATNNMSVLYAPSYITTIPKKVRIVQTTTVGGVKYVSRNVKAYKMTKGSHYFHETNVDIADDTISPVFIEVVRASPVGFDVDKVQGIMSVTGLTEVIGVPTRFLDQVADTWIPFKTHADNEWNKVKPGINAKDVARCHDHAQYKYTNQYYMQELLKDTALMATINKNSPVHKWVSETNKLETLAANVKNNNAYLFALLMNESGMFNKVDISDCPLKKAHDEVMARYKMWPAINTSVVHKRSYHNNGAPDLAWDVVAEYINMVDEQMASTKKAKKTMASAACAAESI